MPGQQAQSDDLIQGVERTVEREVALALELERRVEELVMVLVTKMTV